MNKNKILDKLADIGIVPVVRAPSLENALGAVDALARGGIPVAEITMTVPDAISVIKRLKAEHTDELTIGAGTVTNVSMCKAAIEAGAVFIVTPSVNLEIIEYCKNTGICVVGGALSPTEILAVWNVGANAVKVFPAQAVGGPGYIKAIHAPLPRIPLVPTGGVYLENVAEYLKAGALFVCAGTDLVNKNALATGDLEAISRRAQQYIQEVKKAR